MKPKILIFIFVFLIALGGALATELSPTIQTETQAGTNGIYIEYPQIDYYSLGDGIDLSFHIFNSTGFQLNDTGTVCQVHIYGHDGKHIINAPAINAADDFIITLGSNVTGTAGIYPLLVYCSNSKEAGFISTTFEIQIAAPVENSVGGFPLAALILVPVLFGIMLLIGGFLLDDDHKVLKIGLFLISYLTVFISLWFGGTVVAQYYGFSSLQDAIGTTVWVVGIIFTVIVAYFLIYAIVIGITLTAQKKHERLGY
jgi:hypothetical protein